MNSHQPLILGIDGGGSKCKVRLENNQGQLLAEAVSGPANIATSIELAQQSILDATYSALALAKLPASAIQDIHAFAGLAGASIQAAKSSMLQWPCPFSQFNLSSDIEIAIQAAHGDNDGDVIIIGTGFCAASRRNGISTEFGGYGLLLSDGASGGWLGLQVIRRTLEVLDGLYPASPLIEAVLAELNCSNSGQLSELVIAAKPAYFASFAPLVFEYSHDHYAKQLLIQATEYLARYITYLTTLSNNPLALVGGVANAIKPRLDQTLCRYLVETSQTPEQGAIQLAKKYLND